MFKIFKSIGRYTLLMQKVFSRPEKRRIYYSRIMAEMEALGLNSIGLTAIISVFIGAVVTLQMAITLYHGYDGSNSKALADFHELGANQTPLM